MPATIESGPVRTRVRRTCKSWSRHMNSPARWSSRRGPDSAISTPGANFDDCYVAAGGALIAGATFGVRRSVEYSILEAQHLAAEDMQRAFEEYAISAAIGPGITAARWGLTNLLNARETTGATAC